MELVPIPRLPIPINKLKVEQFPDKVTFTLSDEAIVCMSQNELKTIRSFFDAALHYARLEGFRSVSEYRDNLRFVTVFSFFK